MPIGRKVLNVNMEGKQSFVSINNQSYLSHMFENVLVTNTSKYSFCSQNQLVRKWGERLLDVQNFTSINTIEMCNFVLSPQILFWVSDRFHKIQFNSQYILYTNTKMNNIKNYDLKSHCWLCYSMSILISLSFFNLVTNTVA